MNMEEIFNKVKKINIPPVSDAMYDKILFKIKNHKKEISKKTLGIAASILFAFVLFELFSVNYYSKNNKINQETFYTETNYQLYE